MDNSLSEKILFHINRLSDQFEFWNQHLDVDNQRRPCRDLKKVQEAFEECFLQLGIGKRKDKLELIERMMSLYGGNYLYEVLGPKPLEEYSPAIIRDYKVTIELIEDYMEAFNSLKNRSTEKLLRAVKQDLEFKESIRAYISTYWIKGKYKANPDAWKGETIDFCLGIFPNKSKVYVNLEKLWADIYGEKASKEGVKFRNAYSRSRQLKGRPEVVLTRDFQRYSDKPPRRTAIKKKDVV